MNLVKVTTNYLQNLNLNMILLWKPIHENNKFVLQGNKQEVEFLQWNWEKYQPVATNAGAFLLTW